MGEPSVSEPELKEPKIPEIRPLFRKVVAGLTDLTKKSEKHQVTAEMIQDDVRALLPLADLLQNGDPDRQDLAQRLGAILDTLGDLAAEMSSDMRLTREVISQVSSSQAGLEKRLSTIEARQSATEDHWARLFAMLDDQA
ncbi:hypothetical protein [Meridianimarinicoccus aquatilis]|uniref:Uncharacterized protein n=1 Tax=Meridianimarinicoccus aquatilis TaxID=2552766 RepID=A0A4R6AJ23_9RHOB|nr:hypothetical protein [Fluviibacterium aquatile]QIE43865.1 hypothetical protein G5B39_17800 [Rhodobacteraceae bacterium SC52]TDL81706.1 hypothetical protein E2L05_19840 [Fluviibacterium aquatile]